MGHAHKTVVTAANTNAMGVRLNPVRLVEDLNVRRARVLVLCHFGVSYISRGITEIQPKRPKGKSISLTVTIECEEAVRVGKVRSYDTSHTSLALRGDPRAWGLNDSSSALFRSGAMPTKVDFPSPVYFHSPRG
jgi:hypothetical protein